MLCYVSLFPPLWESVRATVQRITLLAPASTEKGQWRPFIDIYEGNGSWRKVAIPTDDGINMIQPTLWESEKGCISALMRTNKEKIYRSDSHDGGNSWCRAYPTEMPNNNSGIDLAKMDDGTLALVCNPVGDNWGARSPISLFLSHNQGGHQQVDARIAYNEIDLVLLFTDPNTTDPWDNAQMIETIRSCDKNNVPVATNLASAEMLIMGLQRGDLDWREMIRNKPVY